MTKLSRIPVDPPKMGWIINNFWNAITLLDDKDKIKLFLKDILSLVEMKMIAKRLQVAKMLLEENDYLTIRNYTRVT
ncbi:MAG: Trp family transcriptional regulator, partial [bacterium]|nr:Trp family transcriptional regulator [bacterium]